ncbi:MAG TPA: STAS domain-containing protein [Candidatus Dormibacteraeota bacterium]|nr:STAS domain-containing protein [Candidatus Dormibacteraeota bacterium]
MAVNSNLVQVERVRANKEAILERWIAQQKALGAARPELISDADLGRQCSEVLSAFLEGLGSGVTDVSQPAWDRMRTTLRSISVSRARAGWSPSETVLFVFSLKQPLFGALDQSAGAAVILELDHLIDRIGLFVADVHQQGREEVITRQQQELLELSTPVVKLWDGILALPLIGTLDSERTQVVMETLLQALVDTGSTIAIIDITGVPTVDTKVAQHLIQTVSAARLMGADCLISGIRPQIAQTIVHLGVSLPDIVTKATLADAFVTALGRLGRRVDRDGSPPRPGR